MFAMNENEGDELHVVIYADGQVIHSQIINVTDALADDPEAHVQAMVDAHQRRHCGTAPGWCSSKCATPTAAAG